MAQTFFVKCELGSNPDFEVQLTVKIGYGHRSISTMKKGKGKFIVSPPASGDGGYVDEFVIPLGKNKDLSGAKFSVLTTVTQVTTDPNTSVTISVDNGDNEEGDFRKELATGIGSTVSYDAEIRFETQTNTSIL
ncbi:MAG: hypothetical protein ABI378_01040 [Chitinophagaceae bacterium]